MDWILLLALMCLICMAAMAPMMLLGGHGRWGSFFMHDGSAADSPPETARDILDRRYANGELTAERYQQMRADLDTQGVTE